MRLLLPEGWWYGPLPGFEAKVQPDDCEHADTVPVPMPDYGMQITLCQGCGMVSGSSLL